MNNRILSTALVIAILAGAVGCVLYSIDKIKDITTKSKHAAAEARMLDEIGRKLAGGDATIIAPNGACDSPYCPVHGKAGQN